MPRRTLGFFAARVHREAAVRRAGRSGIPRRDFLSGLAASVTLSGCAATAALPPRGLLSATSGKNARVVIVGAGAAGLTCAYRLFQAGLHAQVFEANTRIGGRTWTLRGFFNDGQIAEHGGQLIASSHYAVRTLAAELGLPLVDLNRLYPPDAADIYMISGARYTVDEAVDDYDRYVFDPLRNAYRAAGNITTYYRYTDAGARLDRMSVDAWLDETIPGGSASKIGTLLRLACVSEYGGDSSVQSALNLIYLFGGMPRGRLNLSGTGEDDRFTIEGGNDRLAATMASKLPPGTIRTGWKLVALSRNADGSWACRFQSGNASKNVTADRVVLSIPFTVLRQVDMTGAHFSPRKLRAIAQLDLGSNAKVHLQFTSPYWFAENYSGTAYADGVFQDSWDSSIGQRGKAATLVCFPGGAEGASFTGAPHGVAPASTAQRYLSSLEPVLPGARAAFNGLAYQDFWIGDPFTRGAYSYYKVGQYTTLAGIEAAPEGTVYFCGEQTSYNWQGYINGAVQSGERAAKELLASLSRAPV